MVSSSGLMRTVSFQPSSLASGGRMIPSQPTRLRSCTSKRWKWIGCVSTPLCVIFQIWVPSVATEIGVTSTFALRQSGRVDQLAGRVHVRVQDQVLRRPRHEWHLEAEVAAHAAVVLVEGLAHLVLDRLRLERHGQRVVSAAAVGQGLEGQREVGDPSEPVQGAAVHEVGAVGRVVRALPDDDRVLARLEHAGAAELVREGRLERGQPGRR